MSKKRTPLPERKRLFGEIESRRAKGMTVAAACKELGVKPFNYAQWRRKFAGDSSVTTRGANASPGLSVRVNGSSDLMFVGFGKSNDVLQALNGIASIFNSRVERA